MTDVFFLTFQNHYPILFRGVNGTVAHEFIVDLRPLKVTQKSKSYRLIMFVYFKIYGLN